MIASFMPARGLMKWIGSFLYHLLKRQGHTFFKKASLSTAGSSMCVNKELGTAGFTCMIAVLVVVVVHRLCRYRAQVVGFPQALGAHIK